MLLSETTLEHDWFDDHFEEMKAAALNTPVIKDADSIEIQEVFEGVKTYMLSVPVETEEGSTYFGVMIGLDDDEQNILLYVFVDNMKNSVARHSRSGVYNNSYTIDTADWNEIFSDAAEAIEHNS